MTSTRRIDHLVLAVYDLDAAVALYASLGFQVGARNRHPWGTENHVIQFGSSFLELITVADPERIPPHGPRQFSFGAFVRDYLTEREGLAMFVLDSTDAVADAATFAEQGIGDFEPFSFERAGRAVDGTETHVAFSLAFALDERLPRASFFVCQQHYPEAFWSPQLQRHPNGATDVAAVTLDVEQAAGHVPFLETFTGATASADASRYALARNAELRIASGRPLRGFDGFRVRVPDLNVLAHQLADAGHPFADHADRLTIEPEDGLGARIEFAR